MDSLPLSREPSDSGAVKRRQRGRDQPRKGEEAITNTGSDSQSLKRSSWKRH